MTPEDDAQRIAARIADGSGVDWPADSSAATSHDRGVMDALKAIADVAAAHRSPTDPRDPGSLAGTRWGPLTIVSLIARGGFSEVYRAWEPRLQRQVALKLLDAPSPETAALPTRAIEEARLLARVRHPNVLTVYGAESIDGRVGIWTEFIDGRTLESIVRERGVLPPDEVISIGIDLCRALAAVHDAGLLHRDIKAQNVMRETGGRIVLMDFGTGHDLALSKPREGDLTGTPLYLAPEIFNGGRPSVASDIYAVAVLLFYLVTGQYPVPGRTLADIQAAHKESQAGSNDIGSSLPVALAPIIARGLANDPTSRFATAQEFEVALAQLASLERPATTSAKSQWLSGFVVSSLAVIVIAAILGVWKAVSSIDDKAPLRKITTPQHVLMSRPSPNGKVVAFTDVNGDVNMWNIRTGATYRLTDVGRSKESGKYMVVSPAGDKVVYSWVLQLGAREPRYELRIRDADGKFPRTLIPETRFEPVPFDWSRDGKWILCALLYSDQSSDLVLVPVDGGQPRQLLFQPKSTAASFAPDGRHVVTTRRSASEASEFVVLDLEGSEPHVLFTGKQHDSYPMWSADGTHLLFFRVSPEFPNSSDGLVLSFTAGVAGDPRVFATNLGASLGPWWIALTDDGALYRQVNSQFADTAIAIVDPEDKSSPRVLSRLSRQDPNAHAFATWSPDGKSIAYLTLRAPASPGLAPDRRLSIEDVSSGRVRELNTALTFIGGYSPQWSTDSESVFIWGRDKDVMERFGFYRVDVGTSATTPAAIMGRNMPAFSQCSSNGRELYYKDQRGIIARDFTTGTERIVVAKVEPEDFTSFLVEPQGQSIAVITGTGTGHGAYLQLIAPGGSRRDLFHAQPGDLPSLQAWTHDGRDLIFAKKSGANTASLFRISVRGGEPRDMRFSIPLVQTNPISLSPDGRQMLFFENRQLQELWITHPDLNPRPLGARSHQ